MKRLLQTLLFLMLTTFVHAGKYNPTLEIGQKAPPWSNLPGVDGKAHSLADLKDKRVVVVVFTCNSCPYAADYEDRINAFSKKYSGKNSKVALVAINVNKIEEDLLPAMKKRATAKKFAFAYLFDESQQIANHYGATWTPEFFVLNEQREVIYMGAMDDNTDSKRVKERYVEDAVSAALSGKQVETTETVAIGCRIRFERRRRSRTR